MSTQRMVRLGKIDNIRMMIIALVNLKSESVQKTTQKLAARVKAAIQAESPDFCQGKKIFIFDNAEQSMGAQALATFLEMAYVGICLVDSKDVGKFLSTPNEHVHHAPVRVPCGEDCCKKVALEVIDYVNRYFEQTPCAV